MVNTLFPDREYEILLSSYDELRPLVDLLAEKGHLKCSRIDLINVENRKSVSHLYLFRKNDRGEFMGVTSISEALGQGSFKYEGVTTITSKDASRMLNASVVLPPRYHTITKGLL